MAETSSSRLVDPQLDASLAPATTAPVSAACLACRSRHLKCDARIPVCQRCRENNRECAYVKSRRGWKGTSNRESGHLNTSGSTISGAVQRRIESEDGLSVESYSSSQSQAVSSSLSSLSPTGQINPLPSLVDLFYYYFHNSHPIMIPSVFYGQLLSSSYDVETTDLIHNLLVPVIHYVGSLYVKNGNRALYKHAVEKVIFGSPVAITGPNHQCQFIIPPSPISVMALLLYAIVIHGENEQDKSMAVKDHAVYMALFLNMHDIAFIDNYLDKSFFKREPVFLNVLKESLRRTFWMLFVMDGWMNALHRRPPSKLMSVVPTMELPCEDQEYNVGNIPNPHTLQEFDDRVFADRPPKFSSFSYLIDAIRIIGLVMVTLALSNRTNNAEAAELADTSTSVWLLHIPEAKKTLLRPASDRQDHFEHLGLIDSGNSQEVDELMMHAFIIINNGLILVHKPLSRLAMAPNEHEQYESYCATPRSLLISFRANALAEDKQNFVSGPLDGDSLGVHTLKCMASADTLSRLISLSPGTVNRRSPFFTCSVTLSLLVHLTACVWVFYGPSAEKQRSMTKERIKLGIGALRAMSENWSTAQHVLGQIKEAAQIVFDQHRSADLFLRDVKKRKTMQSMSSAVMNAEPQFRSTKANSNSTIMPSDTNTGLPRSCSATDVLRMDWSYIPAMDTSSGSSEGDNYSGTSSCSPSLNLDSSVLYEGSQGQSQLQQLHDGQTYPTLTELDRAILQHVSMLPDPLISEDELFQIINEPNLVDIYKHSSPINMSDW
ncbi:uncharacterized protein V1513DRAFT_447541 [Lipomyces chichibuensis]|uniref:uncharacterized protein n=1 Tax=Lipomyces chichibuensis TaxID=1546026 RepID=UPI00334437BC